MGDPGCLCRFWSMAVAVGLLLSFHSVSAAEMSATNVAVQGGGFDAGQQGCFRLSLLKSGLGLDPRRIPENSLGCPLHTYVSGETVDLVARPRAGWELEAWRGTDDDASTLRTNSLTMPSAAHLVRVRYKRGCDPIFLEHTGSGADPVAAPLADGTSWAGHSIAPDMDAGRAAVAVDMDSDGDIDMLAAALFDGIRWWDNASGDGTVWTENVIAESHLGIQSLVVGDIDGDNDPDVIVSASAEGTLAWFENTSGDGASWEERVVADLSGGADSIFVADLDADSDLDILGATNSNARIGWWENTVGDGSVWAARSVVTNFIGSQAVLATDIDGDLDLDVVGIGTQGPRWFENTDGSDSGWVARGVLEKIMTTAVMVSADLDQDQDPDIILASGFDAVLVLENQNNGSTWEAVELTNSFLGVDVSIAVADLDSDGVPDVLAANTASVLWWRNPADSGSAWVEQAVVEGGSSLSTASVAADLDGDRDADVLGGHDGFGWWENVYDSVCVPGTFNVGDHLALTADPAPGWEVVGWSGTDDDSSTSTSNTATVVESGQVVTVHYEESE